MLDRLPAHLKTFVLRTAILERMCGPLCDAVLGLTIDRRPSITDQRADADSAVVGRPSSVVGDSYSQVILAELERRQLFIVPLDDERQWYRYHHLFADLLRARLRQGVSVDAVAALHQRASAWFETQGLVLETVRHTLAGQDWEQAARMIEVHGALLMVRGQGQIAMDWLSALPAETMQQHPILYQIQALGLMLTNQVAAAEVRLRDAEISLQPDTPDDLARVVRSRVGGCAGICA